MIEAAQALYHVRLIHHHSVVKWNENCATYKVPRRNKPVDSRRSAPQSTKRRKKCRASLSSLSEEKVSDRKISSTSNGHHGKITFVLQ